MRTADTVDVRPKQEAANPIANVEHLRVIGKKSRRKSKIMKI